MPGPTAVLLLRLATLEESRLARLGELVSGFSRTGDGLAVLLGDLRPEEILAACSAVGLRVRGSRVVMLPRRG